MALTNEYRDYPTTSTAAFGRIFYGQENRILFSQVLVDDINTLGRCYQKNDPTSSELSDILATDGGEVLLQNSGRVLRIVEYEQGVVAFCDRGVWYIYGPQSGFNATEYSVQKVTEFTLYSVQGIQKLGEALFYVAEDGIFVLQSNEFGQLKAQNLTQSAIDTYYRDFVARDIFCEYIPEDKQVVFTSKNQGKVLVYDTRAQGWYPQQIAEGDNKLVGSVRKDLQVYFISSDTANDTHNFSTFTASDFTDFGVAYQSFLLSQPESLENFSNKQTAINLKALFAKTETQITGVDESGNYEFDNPSACYFKALWDFESENSPKTTKRTVNLYKLNTRRILPDAFPWDYNTGEQTVSNRINIRGTGKAVQFKFSSEANKDLQLLGYSLEWAQSGRQ